MKRITSYLLLLSFALAFTACREKEQPTVSTMKGVLYAALDGADETVELLPNKSKTFNLLAKAEELKSSQEWQETTQAFIELQEQWKKIGPVARKYSDDIWKVRGALVKAVEAVSEQEPLDIVTPIDKIVDFVEYVKELEEKSGMKMISFGHAGDGNVHLCVVRGDRNEETWKRELDQNLEELYSRTYELGGLISGEHGLGIAKRSYFFREAAVENVLLMNQIKAALDEKHILNDHKSYVT